jgi:preprotein translocase subunit YajC
MTTGGMLGKVVSLDEGYVVLKVSDNVELKFQKSSVHAVLPKGTLKKI